MVGFDRTVCDQNVSAKKNDRNVSAKKNSFQHQCHLDKNANIMNLCVNSLS